MSKEISPPPEGAMKILLLLFSFLIPLAGLIIGAIYYQKPDEANRAFGKLAIILAAISFLFTCVCIVGFYVLLFIIGVVAEVSIFVFLV